MKLRIAIIISGTIPVIVIFISSIASQYVAITYTAQALNTYADNLFTVQLMFVKLMMFSINLQLQQEIQKFAYMVSTLASMQSKVISGMVNSNSQFTPPLVNLEVLYQNNADPSLTQLFKRDPYAINDWLHQNISVVNDLPQEGKEYLWNSSIAAPLSRTYQYVNDQESKYNQRSLNAYAFFEGFQGLGMLFANGINQTYQNAKLPNCTKGPFVLDTRCTYWFQQGKATPSIFSTTPQFSLVGQIHYLNTGICLGIRNYNQTTQQDQIYSVKCVAFQLNGFNLYFQNFINSTEQSYVIDPRTQTILYNSLQNLTQIQYFYQTEFQFNESLEDVQLLNSTINQNFAKWVYKSMSSSNLSDMIDTQLQSIIQIPYKRNNTDYVVVINPIFLYDKLPQFQGVKSPQLKGFNYDIQYLQINFISNQKLRQQATQLLSKFNLYYFIVGCFLIGFLIISTLVAFYYTYKLNRHLELPIEHLTNILKKLLEEIQDDNLFDIYNNFRLNSEDIFLSQEMYLLFQSFDQIFQMLLYTSENYFNENETTVLLRMYRNIEFFRQFKNTHALGIIHNNIGSILLSQKHFFQSLEHFSLSVLQAQYELEEFLSINKGISASLAIRIFSFNDNNILVINEKSENLIKSISIPQKKMSECLNSKPSNFQASFQKQLSSLPKNQNRVELCDDPTLSFMNNGQNKMEESNQNLKQSDIQLNHRHIELNTVQPEEQVFENSNQISLLAHMNEVDHCKETQKSYIMQDSFIPEQITTLFNKRQQSKQSLTSLSANEQLNNLFLNIYYRKKNYAISLFSFQEDYDQIIEKKRHFQVQVEYNFWSEIKHLLNELIIMIKYIEIQDQEKIELLTLVSKCQLHLKKNSKAMKILMQCKNKEINNTTFEQRESTIKMSKNMSKSQQCKLPFQVYKKQGSSSIENSKQMNVQSQRLDQNMDNSRLALKESQKHQLKQLFRSLESQRISNQKDKQSSFQKKIKKFFKWLFNKNDKIKESNTSYKEKFKIKQLSIRDHQTTPNSNLRILSTQNAALALETTYQTLRNKHMQQYNDLFRNDVMQIVNMGFVDYHIKNKQPYEAAKIITEMFENNFAIYSHLPFQLVVKLRQIFKQANIKSPQVEKMRKRFNKNITLRVSYVIGSQKNSSFQIMESLRLLSNLVNDILTKPNDELGLIYYNQEDRFLETNMELIKVRAIKLYLHPQIEFLYEILLQHQIKVYSEGCIPFKQQNENDINLKIYSDQVNQNQTSSQFRYRNSTIQSTKVKNIRQKQISQISPLHSSILKQKKILYLNNNQQDIDNNNVSLCKDISNTQQFEIKMKKLDLSYSDNNHNPSFYMNRNNNVIDYKIPLLLKCRSIPLNGQEEMKKYSSSEREILKRTCHPNIKTNNQTKFKENWLSQRNIQTEQVEIAQHSFSEKQIKLEEEDSYLNNTTFQTKQMSKSKLYKIDEERYKSNENKLPMLNSNLSFFQHQQGKGDDETPLFESQIDFDRTSLENEISFHLSIRKAIQQFITTNLLKKSENLSEADQPAVSDEYDYNQQELRRNIIIYKEIGLQMIRKSILFTKLIECLHYYDITLLILSNDENNLTLKSPNPNYKFKEVERIQFFLSIEELQTYLDSQRFNITKFIYPTHIQHF